MTARSVFVNLPPPYWSRKSNAEAMAGSGASAFAPTALRAVVRRSLADALPLLYGIGRHGVMPSTESGLQFDCLAVGHRSGL